MPSRTPVYYLTSYKLLEIERLTCIATQSLKRQLFRRRITVLLTAHPAVVFLGRFVELEVAVRGKGLAALTERLHFLRRHRLEAAYDP